MTPLAYKSSYFPKQDGDDVVYNHMTLQVSNGDNNNEVIREVGCWICNLDTFSAISQDVAHSLGIELTDCSTVPVFHNHFNFEPQNLPICTLKVKKPKENVWFDHPFVIFAMKQECRMGKDLYPLLGVPISLQIGGFKMVLC
jgi:hypothetical protein